MTQETFNARFPKANMDIASDTMELFELYNTYGHKPAENGMQHITEAWAEAKADIINWMVEQPSYVGNCRMVIPCELTLKRGTGFEARTQIDTLCNEISFVKRLETSKDENGNTYEQVVSKHKVTGSISVTTEDIGNVFKAVSKAIRELEAFENGIYKPSHRWAEDIILALKMLIVEKEQEDPEVDPVLEKIINQDAVELFEKLFTTNPLLKGKSNPVKAGMKCSRVFQQIINLLGLDYTKQLEKFKTSKNRMTREKRETDRDFTISTSEFLDTETGKTLLTEQKMTKGKVVAMDKLQTKYDTAFAALADMWNSKPKKYYFVISCNRNDYATMSFGNSWASCHTIDKKNIRRSTGTTYSGMYCSGTESYMLDKVSVVTYVLTKLPEDGKLHKVDKLLRCMFHINGLEPNSNKGDRYIIQGRLYPQDKDSGAKTLYKEFRSFMHETLLNHWGVENNMWRKRSVPSVYSVGTHYRDYQYYSNCNVTFPTEFASDYFARRGDGVGTIEIGHNPICPHCGRLHQTTDNLLCSNCR